MKNFVTVGIVCALMLLPTAVWAAQPLGVEDTATEGKGNFLLEVSGDHAKDGSIRSTQLSGIITGGLGEHTDLALEIPYLMLHPSPLTNSNESGKGDARLSIKHKIFENEVKQSMAFEVYANLPTGDNAKGLGTNNLVWGGKLIDSQVCHDNTFTAHIGYALFGRDIKAGYFTKDSTLFAGLAVEHKFTESFRFLTEIKAEIQKESKTTTDFSVFPVVTTETSLYSRPVRVLAGVIYDISRSWYVDLGARAGLNSYAREIAVLAGAAWRF